MNSTYLPSKKPGCVLHEAEVWQIDASWRKSDRYHSCRITSRHCKGAPDSMQDLSISETNEAGGDTLVRTLQVRCTLGKDEYASSLTARLN